MVLEMVGWRDPNVIPIAAFYGDDLKVNFAGKLATDANAQARAGCSGDGRSHIGNCLTGLGWHCRQLLRVCACTQAGPPTPGTT